MNTEARKIGIVIPSFQAAASVVRVAMEAREHSERVVVVDDGSTDDSLERLRQAGVDVLCHGTNRGKGAALRTGMEALIQAGSTHVVTMDADGQHLASQLPRLVARLDEDPDLVLGTRTHLFGEMGKLRRWSNRASSAIISRVAGTKLSDVQTGYRIYSARLFQAVGLPEDGFDAESAVIVRACRAGFPIVVQPVELGHADGRATSHYRPIMDSVRIAAAVARARFGRA